MKVGVFFRGGNPPPWQRDWHEYYQDTLEQVELAEEVGFDAVTTTEHHFSPDGYFPSPLIFEAAMAARTKRVDICSYLILLPLYHPLRFAEDAAMVDVMSGGRLHLGLGVGYRWQEFEGFGVPRDQSGEVMDECVEVLVRAFTEPDEFDFEGKHFQLRGISIQPKPYNKPRPPMWVGAPSPSGLRRVAKWELEGFCGWPDAEAYQRYLKLCERYETKPIAEAQSLIFGHCSDTPEKAYEAARPYAQWMNSYYRKWWWNFGRTQTFGASLQETFVFGDPDTWIERLQREVNAKEPAVSHTFIGFGSNPGMPHKEVMRCIEQFGKEVLPHIEHG